MAEAFQPIAIQPPSDNRLLFASRCLFDLQLLTIRQFLQRELARCQGSLLDVGAGQAPWRELLDSQVNYVAIDTASAAEFGMQRKAGIVYYDGVTIPFPDASFDHLLCSEVLEHVPDEHGFMTEITRVLRPGGTLILTVPWSARVHHLPHDYRRLTRYGLKALLESTGYGNIRIEERGTDVAVLANKSIVMLIRLLRPESVLKLLWCWPLALLLAPVAAGYLLAAHLALKFGNGVREDPLGYGVVAVKE